MAVTIRWTGTITAVSSIAHGGETRGTMTLLRREKIVTPEGRVVHVPIISGNSWRGKLRRVGEDLLRGVLRYEGQLTLPAAHALRGGGALVKTSGASLSGERLRVVRSLLPQVGVFGCAAGGRIIDGCLAVGKLLPHLVELDHVLTAVGASGPRLSAFDGTQLETFVRQDDADAHQFPRTADAATGPGSVYPDTNLMRYDCETFPAGSRFAAWLTLTDASPLEASFFTDVLHTWASNGHLGGRIRAGHGAVTADLRRETLAGELVSMDWREHLAQHRDEAVDALAFLT